MTSLSERTNERVAGRVPPHSVEAEESVLGSVLLSVDATNEVMDKLEPEDFYVPSHQAIFRAVRNLFNSNHVIDAITVSEELRRAGDLERVGGVAYLTRLLDIVPSASNVEYYAGIVEEHSQRRHLMRAGSSVHDLAFRLEDEIAGVLDRAEQTVLSVAGRRVGDGMVALGRMFSPILEELEMLESRGSDVTGLSTGFRDLDRKLTGLHPANLVIIAARPAMGKCLAGDTRVVDPKTGECVTIGELARNSGRRETAHVAALDIEAGAVATVAPTDGFENGLRPTFRVTTRLGREVVATANHPLLTRDGWVEVGDLRPGRTIAVPGGLDVFGVEEVPFDRLVSLANQSRAAGNPRMPAAVFTLPPDQLSPFLERVIDRRLEDLEEGTLIGGRWSNGAAADLQHLLLRFGIVVGRQLVGRGCVLSVEARGSKETVLWDPIVSIEPAGVQPTFDITVPGLHNFVADDIYVHNSALTANIAMNVAMERKPVAIFSLEMSKEEVAQRMLCATARIDSMKLRTGKIGEAAWPRLTDAAGKLYDAPLYVDDSPVVTVTEIRAKCRRLKRQHGLHLIVVDYLQLMQGTNRENRQQEIAEISRSLKNLARELEVPILAVSQLNRNLESREDKRPRLGDLRESGSLEQDADIVIFIYRDEYYNEASDKRGIAEVVVAKHRSGSTGTVEMTFMPEFTRFSDLGRD